MVLPLIPIAMGLAEMFVPKLLGKLAGEGAVDVAKQVIDLGKQITGVSNPTGIADALHNDPQLALQFQQDANKLEAQLAKIDLENTKDARSRDLELHKLGFNSHRADIMIVTAFICLCFIIWALWSSDKSIPAGILAIFNIAVGALLKMLGDAFQFEFGSSRGSKQKSILLGDKK